MTVKEEAKKIARYHRRLRRCQDAKKARDIRLGILEFQNEGRPQFKTRWRGLVQHADRVIKALSL